MSMLPVKSKISADQVLKISPFKEVIKPTVPHKHGGYFELIVLSDGAGEHLIDDIVYEINPPVIFFLKPGQTHCWDLTRIPKGFVLLFKEELLSADLLPIVYQLNTQMYFSGDSGYLSLLTLFNDEYRRGADVKILTAYLRLLLEKTEAIARQAPRPPAHALYYKFKSLLHTNGIRLTRVLEYADMLGISSNRLNLICREASGKSPSAMLNERLLLEAKTLLTSTNGSIKEIAHSLQFTDTSHFVKYFKAATNLTPGAYRDLLIAKG